MMDALPLWFAIPTIILLIVLWFAIEIHHATVIPDDHPEAITGLDELERTGIHPG